MKSVALFLSVFVLVLTMIPCCALEDSESHIHQTEQNGEKSCNERDDNCCKDCSPFYVCGTCVGFTISIQQVIIFATQLKPVQHNFVYIPTELPNISVSIWQPPKIS